jgi:hypothetical protein
MSLLKPAATVAIGLLLSAASFANEPWGKPSLGVPVFPGATPRAERSANHGSKATVSLQDVVVRDLTAQVFVSDQAPEKVLDFYRDELKRHGAVTECTGGRNTRVHVRVDADEVSEPAACRASNFGAGETEIKATSDKERFIISVQPTATGSEFAIIRVESARKCASRECSDMM